MIKSDKPSAQVQRRDDIYAERTATRIWQELPSAENPYIAAQCRCHGYDLLELVQKRSFADMLYLLFRGELPTTAEAQLLDALMVAFINPGPRHPATRAAMNAGVGKTDPALILPIALTTLSGTHNAAGTLEEAMRFLRKNQRKPVEDVLQLLMANPDRPDEGDWHIAPGFGSYYNGIDLISASIADHLAQMPAASAALHWGQQFAAGLAEHGMGWLATGVVAAALTDLGFPPRAAAGVYQIISAPGLLAHGAELANKPLTAMPFISDEDYIIESD
ncbi:citrate synthase [Candidatus Tenderia electrophaga]|jgi:citrate synthase|uniref:Citrate synthase n=1 Tax=Candidatus Tenderia electrophaga TaxID=1748243 RepID=A0A0S2TGD3_9GAMM|nr:citrate synthase [Candidatus Tenderia electrophaga]